METTKQDVITAFESYLKIHQEYSDSMETFSFSTDLKKEQITKYFSTQQSLREAVWLSWIQRTIEAIQSEEVYFAYSAREKILAFMYTFMETIKPYQAFIRYTFSTSGITSLGPKHLEQLKTVYISYAEDLLRQAEGTGEVPHRFLLHNIPKQSLWVNFLFVLWYWSSDDSDEFAKTDIAIDKLVNFTFDLIGRNALDSSVDLAKFFIQNTNIGLFAFIKKRMNLD